MTHERPAALARALDSYLDNCARHGRAVEVVVMDDSRSPGARASGRDLLSSRVRERGAVVSYAGVDEKAAFAEALVARGLPPSVVRFALAPGRASTAGANRNALLLHTVGDAFFSADDDTLCQVASPLEPREGLAVASGGDPADHWFFPDRASALGAVAFVDRDVLAGHEALLGRDVRGLLHASPDGGGDAGLRGRLAARGGRVLATFNGLVGDSGWGAPFGSWLAPMGYLAMRGPSLRRLCASEPGYRAAVTSREIVRVVDRLHVGDPSFSMMGFAGLDNRGLLPPFCPIGRGEDNVFGAVLAASAPDACVGHLPLGARALAARAPALLDRRDDAHRGQRRPGPDPHRAHAIVGARRGSGAAPRAPAHARGPPARSRDPAPRRLRGGGPDAPRRGQPGPRRLAGRAASKRRAAAPRGGLPTSGGTSPSSPSRPTARTTRSRSIWRTAAPLEDARARTQDAVRRFGELLVYWPALVEEARALRARGSRPAIPVDR